MVTCNVLSVIRDRELADHGPQWAFRRLSGHNAWIHRLRPAPVTSEDRVRYHHAGCVNRLCWSPGTGELLASVSDDRKIRLWSIDNSHNIQLRNVIQTDHGHNIFGVRFLDRSGSMMATGANCSTVCISAFDRTIARYTCHKEAVSEIEQPPDQLSVFWSSSEDATIRQWDARTMPECGGQCSDFANCHAKNVLIDGRQFHTPWRFSGIAVSPVDPNLLLVGTGVYGRLFDRRMLSLTSGGGSPPVPIAEYAPRHLSEGGDVNALVTCVSFSPSGRRVVVNFNCDHAYVFDVDNRNDADIVIKSPSPSRLARRIGQMRRKAVDAIEAKKWANAVDVLSAVLSLQSQLSAEQKIDLLSMRSGALLQRQWVGDAGAALRDAETALSTAERSGLREFGVEAAICRVRALMALDSSDRAVAAARRYMARYPSAADELADVVHLTESDPEQADQGVDDDLGGSSDYRSRLVGHAHVETYIKEATFLSEQLVGCASDDGTVFIYDADSGVAVHSLVSEPSDEVCGLNCVRAHPVLGTSCIATSGLDHHVQLFSTSASTRSNVDRSDLVEINQRKLKRYQATSLPGHTTSQVALLIQGLLAGQTPFLFISRDL
ncbi:WD domain, G-beta repeat [Plasmodiophora brassicae]